MKIKTASACVTRHLLLGTALAMALAVGAAPALASTSAQESAQGTRFNIPAQDLGDALTQFARQSGQQLLYAPALVAGKRSTALVGSFTPREGLMRLLSGSGIGFRLSPSGAYLLGNGVPAPVASGAAPAAGPQDAESEADIVVTGTNIRGRAPIGQRLVSISRTDIRESGYGTVQDTLSTAPQIFSGQPNEVSGGGGNFARGSSVNLRGLGTGATLVLVNGRRQPLSGTNGEFVDVSTIPISAVERIDILSDGASAVYGSDAIAGVVNVVLRSDFNGGEVNARVATHDGDATEASLSGALGRSWSTGHVLATYQFSHRSTLAASERAYAADSDKTAYGGTNFSSFYSNPGNILNPNTFQPAFAIPRGQDGRHLTVAQLLPGVVNQGNANRSLILLPEQETHAALISIEQQLGPAVTLFADGRFGRRTITSRSPIPLTVAAFVPNTNPFYVNPFGGNGPVIVTYDLTQVDDTIRARTETWSGTAGARVDFSSNWAATASATYGREQLRFSAAADGLINSTALSAALADSNPATALNVFGDGAVNNPATLALIAPPAHVERARSTTFDANLVVNGTLFELPAGDVRVAFGANYREDRLRRGTTAVSRLSRNLQAVFAEASIPLVARADGDDLLSTSVAGRYEHYSDFGNTFNPRVGVRLAPTRWISFRGSYGTAFRAPNLSDLDDTTGRNSVVLLRSAPDPRSPTGSSFMLNLQGTNSSLREETAESFTLGVDLTPSADGSTRISVNYFNIDYTNKIQAPQATRSNVLAQEAIYASLITRNPTPAQVAALCQSPRFVGNPAACTVTPPTVIYDSRLQNIAAVQTDGLDIDLLHRFRLGQGELSATAHATYIFNYRQAVIDGLPTAQLVDRVGLPLRMRGRMGLNWSQGGFSAGGFLNFTGSYRDFGTTPSRRVDSWTTVDLNLHYDFPSDAGLLRGLGLSLAAVNVFNSAPPFANNQFGYDYTNANPYGRLISLQISKRF